MDVLPLYSRPRAVIFLDDDEQFLEAMAMIMPKEWCIYCCSRQNDYTEQLSAAQAHWGIDLEAHHQMMQAWWGGQSLPQLLLSYWRKHSRRFALPSISFVDYAMPGINGLDILRRTNSSIGSRVLLSGIADASIAIQAFNEELIQQYIVKQSNDLASDVISTANQFMNQPLDFYQGIWRSALSIEQISAIEKTDAQELRSMINKFGLIEYAFMPQPFGILGLSHAGAVQWIQLEFSRDTLAATEIALSAELDKDHVESIRRGVAVSNAEIVSSFSGSHCAEVASLVKLANSDLSYAHFELDTIGKAGLSHEQFLQKLPRRTSLETEYLHISDLLPTHIEA
jgi:CheY-like chemotaxis protein